MNKWINNNNFAKIIALCISLILWLMVHLDSSDSIAGVNDSISTRTIDNVKVQVYNFDESKYVMYGLDPERVTLEVKGKLTKLTSLFSEDDYKVKLDLSNVTPGTKTIPLKCELPNGVECVSITPSSAHITIEAKASKEVQASVITTGEPAEGYELGTPVLKDDGKVTVTLPSSEIDDLAKVQGVLNATGINSDISGKSLKLTAYDKAGNAMEDAEISPSSIDVDVPVIKLYKSVPVTLRTTGSLPPGFALSSVSSDTEQVVVYGPQSELDGISSFPVTVDLGNFTGDEESKYTVSLTPPDGFEKIEPSSIEVTIKATPFEKKTLNDVPVTLENVGSSYTAKLVNPASGTLDVTVEGSTERIAALSSDDLSFSADLSGYSEGTYNVKLEPKLPQYITLLDSGTDGTVQVKITAKDTPAAAEPTPSAGSSSQSEAPSTDEVSTPAESAGDKGSTEASDEAESKEQTDSGASTNSP
ncbi:YbbR-like domain-containing protein [Paenibacillus pinistramenti]|uniref:CdaR family protein n=1 Tax=Paenibacillus pinistramenti TaxID=1768003 RepID=UPI00110870E6|nr:CdaR family protein [Paenibacillus pinistramenti]